jgi:CRISPR-associated endonuclease/helicase Cas3
MSDATLPELPSFADFAGAVHAPHGGRWTPYPWQEHFAELAASSDGPPPSWVVAPTGAGKTIVVDALVWALAAQAELPASERTASTRTVWAIDRRLLVDEVHHHTSRLAERLEQALAGGDDALVAVAQRLMHLATAGGEDQDAAPGGDPSDSAHRRPLVVTRWRGGIARDRALIPPFQPQVITSTVGQIGSRLLFRGFGVGHRSAALAAGLSSNDTTICIDEAHLAIPFRETIDAIRARRSQNGHAPAVPDLHLVTLTATPPEGYGANGAAVELDRADYERLGRRWDGQKTLQLRDSEGKDVEALARATEELLASGSRVLGCVANRVMLARQVHRKLVTSVGDQARVLLLIGPQRPADREAQLDGPARDVLFEGAEPEKPVVVVATQTVEVGLDIDFDGLVTQSASASALTQRLGRLNRSGTRPGRCVVIRDEGFGLYADDEPHAWTWLLEREGAPEAIDASVKSLALDKRRPADRHPPSAATLTEAIVRQLVQTWPRPAPLAEPDIQQHLAGIGTRPSRDVQIVWRCDLRMDDIGPDGGAYRTASLKLVAPRPEEALALSEQAARSLLRARIAGSRGGVAPFDDADVDGGGRGQDAGEPVLDKAPFVVIRGDDILHGTTSAEPSDDEVTLGGMRAGDMIVMPSDRGGADRFGLDPKAPYTIDVHPDLGDPPQSGADDQPPPPIRLNLEATRLRLGWPPPRDLTETAHAKRKTIVARWRAIARHLIRDEIAGKGALTSDEVARLLDGTDTQALVEPVADEYVWRLRRLDPIRSDEADLLEREHGRDGSAVDEQDEDQLGPNDARDSGAEEADEGQNPLDTRAWALLPAPRATEGRDDSSARPDPPTVADHSAVVRERVSGYAEWLGLPTPQRLGFELAALAHDLGKLDFRFQNYFAGGSGAKLPAIAKSVFGTADPVADRRARRHAGLPGRFRHEALSVAILDAALSNGAIPSELQDCDPELAVYLTGVHHGYGRPTWPLEVNGETPPERVVADLLGVHGEAPSGRNADGWLGGRWLQLTQDLLDRYGPWQLAYLEALFALADRTVSREGS